MGRPLRRALLLTLLVLAPALHDAKAEAGGGVRRPRGIYTVIGIDGYIDVSVGRNPSITPAELHAGLIGLYGNVLDNPAVSGLAIQMGWHRLNPNPPSSPQAYDWSYLDDAFSSVSLWNAQNPTMVPKTIMVSLFPGFWTPKWVLEQIPSCDGLFQSPSQTPPSDCGKFTYINFAEPHEGDVLPLPWNPVYKSSFRTFLVAFAAHCQANPAFVSMDVAGPTAATSEIIMPHTDVPDQTQFGGISANDMWLKLLPFAYPNQPAYQKSDQAFIDEWDAAVDMFGEVFSGVTLVVWHGSGLPDLGGTGFTIPSAFKDQCATPPSMDCAAEATILSHLADPAAGGANPKATSGAGLNGRARPTLNILKWLSQSTAHFTSPSAQVLGGEQFGTGFSSAGIEFGCTRAFPPDSSDRPAGCSIPASCTTDACVSVACIPQACLAPGVTSASLAAAGYAEFGNVPAADLIPPEQSLYNALKNYFDGTPAASFFGGTTGTVPDNYLQIYSADIDYAKAHVSAPAPVVEPDGTIVSMTAQDLLNLASQKLLEIAEPTTIFQVRRHLPRGR
ncbi:MAG: hypothetical protein ACHQQS_10710 [Thermoanaerobaculales bacterium]